MKSRLIVRFFFQKSKKQLIIIFSLLLLASVLLNMLLCLIIDYKKNYFAVHDKLNSEHIVMDFICYGNERPTEAVDDALKSNNDISEYQLTEMLVGKGAIKHGEHNIIDTVAIYKYSDVKNNTIGKYEFYGSDIIEGVFLPYYYDVNGFYDIGDSFSFTVGNENYSFTVMGFYNNATTGTINCKEFAYIVSDNLYEEAEKTSINRGLKASIRLSDKAHTENIEGDILSSINLSKAWADVLYSTNYVKLSLNRYVTTTIFTAVIGIASAITLIVLFTIVIICLSNYVKDNIRNLGTLKAMGYVSHDLILPIVLVIGVASILTSAVGILLSYLLLNPVNNIMMAQSGIPYEIKFLPIPFVITIIFVTLSASLTVFLSLSKIRSIRPIMAIRKMDNKVSQSKVLPLHKTHLSLNNALTMKSVITSPSRNIVIFVVVLFISFLIGFSCFCYEYDILKIDYINKLLMEDESDISIVIDSSKEDELLTELSRFNEITDIYVFDTVSLSHKGGTKIVCNIASEEYYEINSCILYKGKLPSKDNEVAVNYFYANKENIKIGDKITLSYASNEFEYTVSGITQGARDSGRSITMLMSAFDNLSPNKSRITYQVMVKEDTDIDALISDIREKTNPILIINADETYKSQSSIYQKAILILAIATIILSICITIFVLYILVSLLLNKNKRTHGILKALGFTTIDLVYETAISFMPMSIIATVIGLAISKRGTSAFFSLAVRSVGICNCRAEIDTKYLVISGLALILFEFLVAVLLSQKIRKIAPHDLFNQE